MGRPRELSALPLAVRVANSDILQITSSSRFLFLPFSQFMKRVQLLLMPTKHQPDTLLLRHVPLSRVHLFTAIQLACLGLLWIIKSTPAAIIFPLMVTWMGGVEQFWETLSLGWWLKNTLLSYFPWLFLVGNPKTKKAGWGMLTDELVSGYLIRQVS